jgi:hypothetical protein
MKRIIPCTNGRIRPLLKRRGEEMGSAIFDFFFNFGLDAHFFQVLSYQSKKAHINVRNEYQGEAGNEIAAPIFKKQLEPGYKEHDCRNVVAEAIFAGKKIEKLAAGHCFCLMRTLEAIFSWLTKNFFVGNRPGDAGDRYGQQE